MRKWFIILIALVLSAGFASSAIAQDDDRPKMRAKVFKDDKTGISVKRPEGWFNSRKKNAGALVLFRASGDQEAQIDVLVSPLERASAATDFFTTFHTNLKKTGFVKREVRKEATYKGKKGLETEYDAVSGKKKFRLIVWQYHEGDTAVLITGFFPTEARDKYYVDYKKVLDELTFE